MKLLLSPSKTMNLDCQGYKNTTQPEFLKESEVLNNELSKLSQAEISAFMNISDKLASAVSGYVKSWSTPFTESNAKPALFTFSGDVYEGLDAATLSDDDIAFAQDTIRILSGLYGILSPLDLIQPYRLEMGRKLATSKGSNLYQFWDTKIADRLNSECGDIIVNLASNEYFKAAKSKLLKADVITPVFKDTSKGKLKVISFYAKKARGMMARYIVQNRISDVDKLKEFNVADYAFSDELSNDKELVFIR